jgi:very-short-patch-repair endonuclease
MGTTEQKLAEARGRIIGHATARIDAVLAVCESPIERLMLAAFLEHGAFLDTGRLLNGECLIRGIDGYGLAEAEYDRVYLVSQVVTGSYRLDFALVHDDVHLAVECDGHDFHEKTRQQARHDKARDRALVAAGWTVLRFTGSEIYADAPACVAEVFKVLDGLRRRAVG